jgi:uncharacterized membrane protein
MMMKLPVDTLFISSYTIDANPPIYYLLSKLFGIFTNYSDIAIRYPSLIFGILTIPAMYFCGREYRNDTTGIFAAGITAILFPLIFYSQFGRAYATMWFFFVITLMMYIRIHNTGCTRNNGILFVIFAVISVWIHLFVIVPIGIMILDSIYTYRKQAVLPAFISGALISPILLYTHAAVELTSNANYVERYGIPMWKLIVITPVELLGPANIILAAFAGIGWLVDESKLKTRLLIIALVTIISVIAVSEVIAIFPRYYSAPLFIFILFVSVLFSKISEDVKLKPVHIVILLVMVITVVVIIQYPAMINHYFVQRYDC